MVVSKTKKNYKQDRHKTKKNKTLFKNRNKNNTKKRNRQRRTKKVYFGGNPNSYMNIIRNYKDSPSFTLKNNNYDLPVGTKIFAFADVHGDFRLLVKLLELSGVMKQNVELPQIKTYGEMKGMYDVSEMQKYFNGLKWTGDSNYVVQIGDQIDRTRDVMTHDAFEDEGSTFEIVYLLLKLNELAIEYNKSIKKYQSGQNYVFSMLGNHEIMNVKGDLRYCSLAEFKVFARRLNSKKNVSNYINNENKNSNLNNSSKRVYSYGDNDDEDNENSISYHRKIAYKPGGTMANLMSKHYHTLLQIGPFLFVHGGLPSYIAANYKLKDINYVVSKYLRGDKLDMKDELALRNIINGDRSLLWNRDMSQDSHRETRESRMSSLSNEIPIFKKLADIMNKYSNKNTNNDKPQVLCVGHTPQYFVKEDANLLFSEPKQSDYSKTVYQLKPNTNDVLRLDTGASRAFGEVRDKVKGEKKGKHHYRRPQIAVLSINFDETIDIVIKS